VPLDGEAGKVAVLEAAAPVAAPAGVLLLDTAYASVEMARAAGSGAAEVVPAGMRLAAAAAQAA